MDYVYVGKLFLNTMRFGAKRSKGPNHMARKNFNNICSTWFTRELKSVILSVYLCISTFEFLNVSLLQDYLFK